MLLVKRTTEKEMSDQDGRYPVHASRTCLLSVRELQLHYFHVNSVGEFKY